MLHSPDHILEGRRIVFGNVRAIGIFSRVANRSRDRRSREPTPAVKSGCTATAPWYDGSARQLGQFTQPPAARIGLEGDIDIICRSRAIVRENEVDGIVRARAFTASGQPRRNASYFGKTASICAFGVRRPQQRLLRQPCKALHREPAAVRQRRRWRRIQVRIFLAPILRSLCMVAGRIPTRIDLTLDVRLAVAKREPKLRQGACASASARRVDSSSRSTSSGSSASSSDSFGVRP